MKELLNKITLGEWENYISKIPDNSIDLILTDPPYNTTACAWDRKVDLEKMFTEFNRVIKDKGVIVITGSQPFTTDLINANRKYFKYEWIWSKIKVSNFQLLSFQPGKVHENIIVFSKSASSFVKNNNNMNYYPIKERGKLRIKNTYSRNGSGRVVQIRGKLEKGIWIKSDTRHPKSIITFSNADNSTKKINPTQKPEGLWSYLIKTYTHENNLVLDCFSGSGTTAVCCKVLNRKFICFEKDQEQYEKSIKRLDYNNSRKKDLF